jgi:hypothetical protein
MKPSLIPVLAAVVIILSLAAPLGAQDLPRFKEARPPDGDIVPRAGEVSAPKEQEIPRFKEVRPPNVPDLGNGGSPNTDAVPRVEKPRLRDNNNPAPKVHDLRPANADPAREVKQFRPTHSEQSSDAKVGSTTTRLAPRSNAPSNAPQVGNGHPLLTGAGPRVEEPRLRAGGTAAKVQELQPANADPAPNAKIPPPYSEQSSGKKVGYTTMLFPPRFLDANNVGVILMIAVLCIVIAISLFFKIRRNRVQWAVTRQSTFVIHPNTQGNQPAAPIIPQQSAQPEAQQPKLLYTQTIWVQNTRFAPVDGVEVVLSDPPQHFEVKPQRQYAVATNKHRNLIIRFGRIKPREQISLAMLNAGFELPHVTRVHSNDGIARETQLPPQQILARPVMLLWRTFDAVRNSIFVAYDRTTQFCGSGFGILKQRTPG